MEAYHWKVKLDTLVKYPDQTDTIAEEFKEAIEEESTKIDTDQNYVVSDFWKYCPHAGSKINKTTGVADRIIQLLFPEEENITLKEKKYGKLLHRISTRFYKQQAEISDTWKNLIKDLNEDITRLDDTIHKFHQQILADQTNLLEGRSISSCVKFAPKIGSVLDRRYRFAKEIALKMYPIDETQEDILDDREESFSKYSALLAKLTDTYNQQELDKKINKRELKNVKEITPDELFQLLKDRPTSSKILEPTAVELEIVSADVMKPIYDHLRTNQQIQEDFFRFPSGTITKEGKLDLYKQGVGSANLPGLMEAVRTNTHIRHFLLGNNLIGDEGLEILANGIPQCQEFAPITWYLGGNRITHQGLEKFLPVLAKQKNINSLWLKRNPIKEKGAVHIAKYLESNPSLKILDLQNTAILDEGLEILCHGLRQNTNLRIIYLDANGITYKGLDHLIDYFQYLVDNNLRGITSLYISMNYLYDKGAIKLVKVLKSYPHLKRLVLASNGITHEGSDFILESLKSHPKLKILDLGLYKATADMETLPNNMGQHGAPKIAEYIRENKTLKVMSILHNNIPDEEMNKIADALESNTTLLYMYFPQFNMNIHRNTQERLKAIYQRNIQNQLHMSQSEFMNNYIRQIKHGKDITNIDSIYRNDDK